MIGGWTAAPTTCPISCTQRTTWNTSGREVFDPSKRIFRQSYAASIFFQWMESTGTPGDGSTVNDFIADQSFTRSYIARNGTGWLRRSDFNDLFLGFMEADKDNHIEDTDQLEMPFPSWLSRVVRLHVARAEPDGHLRNRYEDVYGQPVRDLARPGPNGVHIVRHGPGPAGDGVPRPKPTPTGLRCPTTRAAP